MHHRRVGTNSINTVGKYRNYIQFLPKEKGRPDELQQVHHFLHVNKEQTQLEVALVIPDKYYLYHLLSGTVPIHGTDRNEFTRYLGRDKHNVGAKCTPYTVITKSVITPGP